MVQTINVTPVPRTGTLDLALSDFVPRETKGLAGRLKSQLIDGAFQRSEVLQLARKTGQWFANQGRQLIQDYADFKSELIEERKTTLGLKSLLERYNHSRSARECLYDKLRLWEDSLAYSIEEKMDRFRERPAYANTSLATTAALVLFMAGCADPSNIRPVPDDDGSSGRDSDGHSEVYDRDGSDGPPYDGEVDGDGYITPSTDADAGIPEDIYVPPTDGDGGGEEPCPLNPLQEGPCEGSRQTRNFDTERCESDYSGVEGYREVEICDGVNNDCRNGVDDGLEVLIPCDVYNTNRNGLQARDCIEGAMQNIGECDDDDECNAVEYPLIEPCTDIAGIGICSDDLARTDNCLLEGDDYILVVGECVGTQGPESEDLDRNGVCTPADLDGYDNNCRGDIDEICMVEVERGDFYNGCDSLIQPCGPGEQPGHTVYLEGYKIDKFETTVGQYEKCVEDGACDSPADATSYSRANYFDLDDPAFNNYPVIHTNWFNADDYCIWAGKRLPTEAEWEKAARGGEQIPDPETGDMVDNPEPRRRFPWEGTSASPCTHANYGTCWVEIDNPDTAPVGSFPDGASPYGAMDLAGNVNEWAADWFDENYYSRGEDENPQGPADGAEKVVRGGRMSTSAPNVRQLYTYARGSQTQDHTRMDLGFRCADSTEVGE